MAITYEARDQITNQGADAGSYARLLGTETEMGLRLLIANPACRRRLREVQPRTCAMTPYAFIRADGFYPLELKDDEQARENAECNEGTLQVVNMITKAVVWQADDK